jgi:nucleotide-binding universal stress UspA family protein
MLGQEIVRRADIRCGSAALRPRRIGRIVCALDGPVGAGPTLDAAEALAGALRSRLVGVSLAGQRTTRDRAERLLELVSAERADLLFVPGPRSGPFGTARTGRLLRDLLRLAPCPVVALPPNAEPSPRACGVRGSIVCGVDASPGSRLAASLAGALAARLGVRVIAVHAHDAPHGTAGDEEIMRAWRLLSRTVDGLGDSAEGRLVFGSPRLMLNAVSAREQSRLIVVGDQRAGLLRSTLSHSVSMQLASTASRPVVIAPPATRAGAFPRLGAQTRAVGPSGPRRT